MVWLWERDRRMQQHERVIRSVALHVEEDPDTIQHYVWQSEAATGLANEVLRCFPAAHGWGARLRAARVHLLVAHARQSMGYLTDDLISDFRALQQAAAAPPPLDAPNAKAEGEMRRLERVWFRGPARHPQQRHEWYDAASRDDDGMMMMDRTGVCFPNTRPVATTTFASPAVSRRCAGLGFCGTLAGNVERCWPRAAAWRPVARSWGRWCTV